MQHLTQKQFEDFASQRLGASELLAVSDHLDECEACRRRLEANINPDLAFFSFRSEILEQDRLSHAHFTIQQLSDYVDAALSADKQQEIDDHLNTCDQCALAVADLRQFRNELWVDREYQPAVNASQSWWQRTFPSLPSLFRSPVPAFGGAALAALVVIVLGWLMLRKQSEQQPTQQIAVAPAPASQPSQAPSPIPQPTQSGVVAQLNDGGGVITLDEKGNLSGAEKLPPNYQRVVKTALASRQITRPSQLSELARPASSLMGSNDANEGLRLIGPVGSIVLNDRPNFVWSPLKGASSHTVEVYDSDFNLVAKSAAVTGISWTSTQRLARGKVYSWQVKANRNGEEITSPKPPAPQAKFRVLDQAKANELFRAKLAYGSSHLMLALLYADAGLLTESEQQLRLLLRANPDSELARKLLAQIQLMRR